jgi:DNA-binding beta-propeller fold protein YncE
MARCGAGISSVLLTFLFPISLLATSSDFQDPTGMAVDSNGQIYVADQEAQCIFLISENMKVFVFAKGGGSYRSPLYRVRSVTLDKQGRLLAADPASSEVYRIGHDGKMTALTSGKLDMPVDIAINQQGDVLVADLGANAIRRIANDGSVTCAEHVR